MTKLGLSGLDPRLSTAVAAVLLVLGFLFPPAIVCLGVGIPVGLLGGQIDHHSLISEIVSRLTSPGSTTDATSSSSRRPPSTASSC